MAIPARAFRHGKSLSGPQIVPRDQQSPAGSSLPQLPDKPPRWPSVVMMATGALSLLLGLLVLASWHTGHILLPLFLLIQGELVRYNTSLCCALGGLALLLLAREKLPAARVPGLLMAMVGLLTSCEYLFGLNLGIDELLFSTRRLAPSIRPRMAPNTAASFFLLGGALLLTGARPRKLRNTLQAYLGALAAAVGLVGFIGYLADIPTAYGWGKFAPMAAPTAASICALGLGVVAFAWGQHARRSATLPSWGPPLAGLSLAAGSITLWRALHALRPQSGIAPMVLLLGLLQAGLLYLVLHLLGSAGRRSQQLRQLNSLLQIQMHSLERAERELQAKHAYTRSLIEASLDPLVTIAPDGKITDVNAAAEAATGRSRQELIGTDFCDYFTEPEKARAGYQQVFREGGVRDYELAIRDHEGRVMPVLYNASVYHDQAGAVIGVFAAARDITQHKRTEQALRCSEERYRALLVATAQVVWTTPPDGVVEDMPMWREYTGQSLEQVRGWGWLDAIHPEDRERTVASWSAALAARSMYDTEYRIRRADGHFRYFAVRGVPVLEPDGSLREWVGTCSDIHRRKQLVEDLRAREAYTRSLIEASLDPLVTIAAEGKITDVNRATEEVTGVVRAQLVGSDFCNYFTEPDKARAGYQQVFAEGLVQDYALAIRHRDGHVTDVLYNASVFRNEAGEVEGVFAAARDITERKRLEDSLRQRTLELENSVAELEAFSYSVSHDLRAPLRSIDGFSQILLEDYRDKVDAEGQDSLRRIRNASQSMGQLIDALLQLSRVMRTELSREPVDLSVLALATAAVIQKADPERRVRFHVATGLRTHGDRRLLGVALQNLLQNAWKFSARNPEPTVEFGSLQEDGKTAYYVRDNGIGFDMTYVNKLFTPFQRLHAKEQFEGTGIGLATVKRVIKRHGGQVWAEGAVGKGATFYFTLD